MLKPLDDAHLHSLLAQLDAWRLQAEWGRLPSTQPLQGVQWSRQQGSGSEFAESRPYAQGDEIRHLDWRLMARSGEVFSRRFEESRQAQWVLLVDLREPMWFGTRRQFKVSQMLNWLGLVVWQAQRHNVNVQLWVLAQQLHRLTVPQFSGQAAVLAYLQLLNQPQSVWLPQQASAMQPGDSLSKALQHLLPQVASGARLMVFSDLHDLALTPKLSEQLAAWRKQLVLQFCWFYDRAEVALPPVSGLTLVSRLGVRLRLDQSCDYQAYQEWAQTHFQDLERILVRSGSDFVAIGTHLSLPELGVCFQRLGVHNFGVLAGLGEIKEMSANG
ncbi:MAG: DUF58 domain-containing protein [Thiotrichales bacterium]|nr:DUF58 domain-containing protein [Thiotrichales bacterium]